MKKLAGLIIVSSVLAFATSVFATTAGDSYSAVYTGGGTNKVTINSLADNYSVVLITKDDGTTDNIVYVDQNDDTFDSALNCFLKSGLSNGYYKVQLGTDNGLLSPNPGVMYFYVGTPSASDVEMDSAGSIQDGSNSRIGWYVINQSLNGLYSIKVSINNGTTVAGFSLQDAFNISGSGTLSAGFQLEGLTEAQANPSTTKAFLSPDKVSNFRN